MIFSNFSMSKMTQCKSVARCVAIIIMFYKKIMVLFRLNLIKIIHQNATNCINHYKIFSETMPRAPYISVADITIYFYMKVAIFYLKFFQNINYNASFVVGFQKLLREYPYNNYFLYKNMLSFRAFFQDTI